VILELVIEDPKRTPVEWWPQVDALKGTSRVAFRREGLTVLWGPNGSGKSTLLRMIARLTRCSPSTSMEPSTSISSPATSRSAGRP